MQGVAKCFDTCVLSCLDVYRRVCLVLIYFVRCSEEDFYPALERGEIKSGSAVIFRYQGPKGGPGMPEVSLFTSLCVVELKKITCHSIDVRFVWTVISHETFHKNDTKLDLGPTGAIMGAGLGNTTCLITDGRFSGASRGFIIGHVVPEALLGGPIALVQGMLEIYVFPGPALFG
jgi:dihydroxy-acid dehydratase